jgi:predicted alpha/beta superfamily hydrolase
MTDSTPRGVRWRSTRRWAVIALLGAAALLGCGGGSSSGDAGSPMEGSREFVSVLSHITGTAYPLSVYVPPASAGPRSGLPVLYALDGESWFELLVGIAEATHAPIIIVAINTAGLRNRDYVPANNCTPNGGGQAAYFDFIRQELIPYVEGTIGGDPARRALLGHSHGGSFVLYAMFSEAPEQHSFSAYLASDASVSCMPDAAYGWNQAYVSSYAELPVRLDLSYATQGNYTANVQYAQAIEASHYARLAFTAQAYTGTHGGIVPAAFTDALGFAFQAGP